MRIQMCLGRRDDVYKTDVAGASQQRSERQLGLFPSKAKESRQETVHFISGSGSVNTLQSVSSALPTEV